MPTISSRNRLLDQVAGDPVGGEASPDGASLLLTSNEPPLLRRLSWGLACLYVYCVHDATLYLQHVHHAQLYHMHAYGN